MADRTCSVDGCANTNIAAKSLCWKHYARSRKGAPVKRRTDRRDRLGRFLELIRIDTDDCLLWPYSTDPRGYGMITVASERHRTHRLSCELRNGAPPSDGAQAAHSCGNPTCINPRHLRWATNAENSHDRYEHGTGKLNARHVREIRQLLSDGEEQADIAECFNVSQSTVSAINTGRRWSTV